MCVAPKCGAVAESVAEAALARYNYPQGDWVDDKAQMRRVPLRKRR